MVPRGKKENPEKSILLSDHGFTRARQKYGQAFTWLLCWQNYRVPKWRQLMKKAKNEVQEEEDLKGVQIFFSFKKSEIGLSMQI